MKKILVWDDEKDAFVLVKPGECFKESGDCAMDYYGKMISWTDDVFDKVFIPTAKLHGFAFVLDDRINAMRAILSDFELLKKKILLVEEELSKKDSRESDSEAPF